MSSGTNCNAFLAQSSLGRSGGSSGPESSLGFVCGRWKATLVEFGEATFWAPPITFSYSRSCCLWLFPLESQIYSNLKKSSHTCSVAPGLPCPSSLSDYLEGIRTVSEAIWFVGRNCPLMSLKGHRQVHSKIFLRSSWSYLNSKLSSFPDSGGGWSYEMEHFWKSAPHRNWFVSSNYNTLGLGG